MLSSHDSHTWAQGMSTACGWQTLVQLAHLTFKHTGTAHLGREDANLLLAAAGVVGVPLGLGHAGVLLLGPGGSQLGGLVMLRSLVSLGVGVAELVRHLLVDVLHLQWPHTGKGKCTTHPT